MSISELLQSPLMHFDTWSLLKMSGVPCFANTLLSASIQEPITHKNISEPKNSVMTTLMIIAHHMTCHLTRPIPERLQKLLINDRHVPQVLGALVPRFILQIGSHERQQCALPTHAQLMILANHFLPRVPSNWYGTSVKKRA